MPEEPGLLLLLWLFKPCSSQEPLRPKGSNPVGCAELIEDGGSRLLQVTSRALQ